MRIGGSVIKKGRKGEAQGLVDDQTAQPNAQRHEKKSIFTLQVAEGDWKLH